MDIVSQAIRGHDADRIIEAARWLRKECEWIVSARRPREADCGRGVDVLFTLKVTDKRRTVLPVRTRMLPVRHLPDLAAHEKLIARIPILPVVQLRGAGELTLGVWLFLHQRRRTLRGQAKRDPKARFQHERLLERVRRIPISTFQAHP